MKAYFSGREATLHIEPENEQEESMLKMWHMLNLSDRPTYDCLIEPGYFGGLLISGVTVSNDEPE
ncbi:hypothetical protein TUM17576_46910 [Enterobacter hormaechei]|nr:hypothetical protein [Enterobacter hormaechei]GJL37871.1 hypothetical protein TUM17576_46910 [Enterobacter hormaechei]